MTMMKRTAAGLSGLAGLALCLALPVAASAQVRVEVNLPGLPPPPTVQFTAPPQLVEVSPGVQVVPDYDEEIFFVDNAYWVRRGRYWYRSDDYRGGWVAYQGGPRPLVRYKPGRYRGWHPRGRAVVAPPPGPVVVVRPGHPGRGYQGGPVVVTPPPAPGPERVIINGPGPGRGNHGHGHGNKHRRGDD